MVRPTAEPGRHVSPTEQIRRDAAELVRRDGRFRGLDPSTLPIEIWGPGFGSLIHLILGQQVSIEAADAMYANLKEAVGTVSPESILRLDDDTMRRCGFTRMKVEYARGLANATLDGFSVDRLTGRPAGAVIESLMSLRGVGRWTAECYLVFCLGRRDVFPAGDLALRIGYQELVGAAERPSESELQDAAEQWAPMRTAAAYLVWQGYLERRGRG